MILTHVSRGTVRKRQLDHKAKDRIWPQKLTHKATRFKIVLF